ncbi:hypothetical protein KAR91_36090 [Candidatus Pacearchaeota archaeon]|nr:hypothetical protein [Candidatus Pacearchaeota archaeon]
MSSADLYKSTSNNLVDIPGLMISQGHIPGIEVVHKFGRNAAIPTTFEPVSIGGLYPTPQVSGATALRIKAGGNANDTVAGSGARKVTLQGLDETGALITEEVSLAGASASAATTATFLRLFRFFVSESGAYGTFNPIGVSQAAAITIENAAGTEDWGIVDFETAWGRGQSEVGLYTVPLGKVAFVSTMDTSVDVTKVVDIVAFSRRGILDTVAPYQAIRTFAELSGVSGEESAAPSTPYGPFPALTDIGMVAKVTSGTAEMDVHLEILLIDE